MTETIDLSCGAKEHVILARVCYICREKSFVIVDAAKYRLWDSGSLIQNVWPEFSPAEREMIKLGYHAECWEQMFNSPEEDEE